MNCSLAPWPVLRVPPQSAHPSETIGHAAGSLARVASQMRDAMDGAPTSKPREAATYEFLSGQVQALRTLQRRLAPEVQAMEQESNSWLEQSTSGRVQSYMNSAQQRLERLVDELSSSESALRASAAREDALQRRLERTERLLAQTQHREQRQRLAMHAMAGAKLNAESKLAACEDELARLKLVHDELRKTATLRWPREP